MKNLDRTQLAIDQCGLTRGGKSVKIYTCIADGYYPIHGVIEGCECATSWSKIGTAAPPHGANDDLFNNLGPELELELELEYYAVIKEGMDCKLFISHLDKYALKQYPDDVFAVVAVTLKFHRGEGL